MSWPTIEWHARVGLSDLEMMCLSDPGPDVVKLEFEADWKSRVMLVGETDQLRVRRQTQRLTTFSVDVHMLHAVTLPPKTRVECTFVWKKTQKILPPLDRNLNEAWTNSGVSKILSRGPILYPFRPVNILPFLLSLPGSRGRAVSGREYHRRKICGNLMCNLVHPGEYVDEIMVLYLGRHFRFNL